MSKKELPKAYTMPREPEVISKEYADLCAMAGDKNYRIDVLKAELRQINDRLFKLNQEHDAYKKLAVTLKQPVEETELAVKATEPAQAEAMQ